MTVEKEEVVPGSTATRAGGIVAWRSMTWRRWRRGARTGRRLGPALSKRGFYAPRAMDSATPGSQSAHGVWQLSRIMEGPTLQRKVDLK
jgi:hypothetical protein